MFDSTSLPIRFGIEIPETRAHVRFAGKRGKLQRGCVHVGDAVLAIHGAEGDWDVFQRFAGKLARAVDLHRQRCLLFRGFAAHPRHFQLCFDTRNQFAGREGLGEVVVGSGFNAFDAGLFTGARREHDDGDGGGRRILAQRGEQRESIHLRHHHVGQDERWRPAVDFFQRQFSVCGGYNFKTPRQQRADILAHIGVIVHEKHDRLVCGCVMLRSSSWSPATEPAI